MNATLTVTPIDTAYDAERECIQDANESEY
jgi:hypothetical protein